MGIRVSCQHTHTWWLVLSRLSVGGSYEIRPHESWIAWGRGKKVGRCKVGSLVVVSLIWRLAAVAGGFLLQAPALIS